MGHRGFPTPVHNRHLFPVPGFRPIAPSMVPDLLKEHARQQRDTHDPNCDQQIARCDAGELDHFSPPPTNHWSPYPKRCTIPGLVSPPMPDKLAPQRAIKALTRVLSGFHCSAGCTTKPAGLLITRSSSSCNDIKMNILGFKIGGARRRYHHKNFRARIDPMRAPLLSSQRRRHCRSRSGLQPRARNDLGLGTQKFIKAGPAFRFRRGGKIENLVGNFGHRLRLT